MTTDHTEHKKEQEFDPAVVWNWMKNNYYIFLILIPIILSIFLRVMPAYLPVTDAAAEQRADEYIRSQLAAQIQSQYPNLPPANQQSLLETQYKNYLKENEQQVQQMIEQQSVAFKQQFQDDSGQTYLIAIDPWHWYRLTRNYVEHGYEGDVEHNGKYIDDHIYAGLPLDKRGGSTNKVNSFHVLAQAWFYKIGKIFNKDLSVLTAAFYTPLIFGTLAVIPAFFIGRRMGGDLGGFIGATVVAFHRAALTRTVAGFSDTDVYNIFFPLVITWVFVEAYHAKSLWKKGILSVLTGLFVGMYSFAWAGWWNIFDFIFIAFVATLFYQFSANLKQKMRTRVITLAVLFLALFLSYVGFGKGMIMYLFAALFVAAIGYTLYYIFKHQKDVFAQIKESLIDVKPTGIMLILYVVSSILFTMFFTSWTEFTKVLSGPGAFSTLKDVATTTLWPNVFTTVAEQNSASISLVTSHMGGMLLVFLSLLGTLLLFKYKESEHNHFLFAALAWLGISVGFFSKFNNTFIGHLFLLSIPLISVFYLYYKHNHTSNAVLVGSATWLALMIVNQDRFSNLILFLVLLAVPVLVKFFYDLFLGEKRKEVKYALLLFIWLLATFYSSVKGIRFTLLMVAPFAIALGVCAHYLVSLAAVSLKRKLNLHEMLTKPIVILVFLLLLVTPYTSAKQIAQNEIPSMNDQWYATLTKIKDNSADNAIVNSWWDFGHWFKAIADRPVTLDGGNQNAPQAHWLGKLMLTDSEQESIAILRMLDCGANLAFSELDKMFDNNQVRTKEVIDEIILLGKEDARAALLGNELSAEQADLILQYTHCEPPENYFITSWDMVAKSGVWAHFGMWDFKRAQVINFANNNKQEEAITFMQEKMDLTEQEARQTYAQVKPYGSGDDANTWIAPWPRYQSTETTCNVQDGTQVICQNGVQYDSVANEVYGVQPNGNKLYARKASVIDGQGNYRAIDYDGESALINPNTGQEYGVSIYVGHDGVYRSILMNLELTNSIFNRMFYLAGQDLECFDIFDATGLNTPQKIYVWKVDWQCESPNQYIQSQNE